MVPTLAKVLDTTPAQLRAGMLTDRGRDMRLRRAAATASLLGITVMAATTLLQMGIVRRLPDPPLRGFDARKVTLSDEAYRYGGPDSPINLLAHAVDLVIASTGTPQRAKNQPWISLLAVALELRKSVMAAKYLFRQMPRVEKAWCTYCILDALTDFAMLALLLPEAAEALEHLRGRRSPTMRRLVSRLRKLAPAR